MTTIGAFPRAERCRNFSAIDLLPLQKYFQLDGYFSRGLLLICTPVRENKQAQPLPPSIMQAKGKLGRSAPEEITVPKCWMPSRFASPSPAQWRGDVSTPVPEAPATVPPLPAAQNRSSAASGGIRAASGRFMHALKMQANGEAGNRTRSYTPFTSRTTSPKLKPAPQLHNSDSPRTQLDDTRIAPRALADQHEQATRARLTEKLADSTSLEWLGNKQTYLDIVNARFHASREKKCDAHNVLTEVLKDISHLLGNSGTKEYTMQDIGMLCVTEAALRACEDDPAAAARALCCLRNIDLRAGIRNGERMPESVARPSIHCPKIGAQAKDRVFRFTEEDLSLAWKIAQELEATSAGYAALKVLTQNGCTEPNAHPSIERHDDAMLHAYLQASRVKHGNALKDGEKGESASAAPHGIAMLDGEPSTVVDKAIGQIRRHLLASHEHGQKNPASPFVYQMQQDEHEWAIGFIRNGLYTDEITVDGKSTAYAQIEGRLNKVSVWCERATSGKDAVSTAWRTAAPYLMPGYRKSPLNAYNALEAEQGFRKCGVGLENSAQGIIHDARVFKEDILGNLIKGLKSCGGIDGGPLSTQPGGSPRDLPPETMRNLARLAVLMEAAKNTLPFTGHLHGNTPDAYTIDQARQRLCSWLAEGDDRALDTIRADIDNALAAAKQPLTLDRLQEWANVLPKAPGKETLAASACSTGSETDRPDWDAFTNAIRRVRSGIGDPVDAPHFRKLGNKQDKLGTVGEVIEQAAARMELGSRLSFTSGGFVGAGAKEATRFLSSSVLGLFRPWIDLSTVRKREAILEMETSAGGNRIFVGTRSSMKVQFGGGIGAGPSIKFKNVAGFKAGGSIGAFFSEEKPAMRGVQLRLSRSQSGGMAGDRDNNVLLGRLFRKYVVERNSPLLKQDPDHVTAPGEDGNSTLKNLLQACPELNVSLLKTTEKLVRKGVSVKGGASVNVGPLSFGPSVGIRYKGEQAKIVTWTETQAELNVAKSGHGRKDTMALTGEVHALRQIPKTVKTLNGPESLPERVRQASGSLLKAMCVTSEEIGSWGKAGNYTLVIENGVIGNGSRATVTHRDAESFIASVEPKLDRWAVSMAHRFQKDKIRSGAGSDVYRQEAYDRAYATLKAQLKDAHANGNMQTLYTEVFELADDALEIANSLRSAIALFERSGDEEKAAAYSEKLDALLASDEAWMPHLLWTQRTTRREAATGLRFGLYAGKTDAVSSSSIKMLG